MKQRAKQDPKKRATLNMLRAWFKEKESRVTGIKETESGYIVRFAKPGHGRFRLRKLHMSPAQLDAIQSDILRGEK